MHGDLQCCFQLKLELATLSGEKPVRCEHNSTHMKSPRVAITYKPCAIHYTTRTCTVHVHCIVLVHVYTWIYNVHVHALEPLLGCTLCIYMYVYTCTCNSGPIL